MTTEQIEALGFTKMMGQWDFSDSETMTVKSFVTRKHFYKESGSYSSYFFLILTHLKNTDYWTMTLDKNIINEHIPTNRVCTATKVYNAKEVEFVLERCLMYHF